MFFFIVRHPPGSRLFPYTTLFRSGEAGDRTQGGRFSRAVSSEQRDHFAFCDGERQTVEDMAEAVVGLDAPDLEDHAATPPRSEEHTSELQSHSDLVCRLLLEKKNK